MPRKPRAETLNVPDLPPVPPPSSEDIAREQRLLEEMRSLTERLRQRNLDNAVALAQLAARGHGPLVEHFQELGRRFARTLDKPQKPKLRVVN